MRFSPALIALAALLVVACSDDASTAPGEPTSSAGDVSPSDPGTGDVTNTGGEPTGGEPTGGEPTGG
ncbi:MAG: hypothetical protein EA398_01110, partial [Deltaproteobacteria bacterium]